jgi:hypothetical protein
VIAALTVRPNDTQSPPATVANTIVGGGRLKWWRCEPGDLAGDDCTRREAADATVARLARQVSGGIRRAQIHLASSRCRNMPPYQRFGADANRAHDLGLAADDHDLLGRNPGLSPDPRMVTSAAVPE